MAVISWYDANAVRAFPFIEGTTFTPTDAIVDCGFLVSPFAGFIPGEHEIYLFSVYRLGSTLTYTFRSDAPGLAGVDLTFTGALTDEAYAFSYGEETLESNGITLECGETELWSGYLTLGSAAQLAEMMPSSPFLMTGQATVEPALIRVLTGRAVTSVNIANVERTRYEPPAGCKDVCWPFEPADAYVSAVCVTGPIRFREGYNISISTDTFENAILFGAGPGNGDGEPCEQIPLFPEEAAPGIRSTLDGGLKCSEVVRSINGVGGKLLKFTGGLGASVRSDQTNHRLIVDLNMVDMAVCATVPAEDDESVSASIETSLSCECGEEP